jgi:hypothetical protein
MYPTTGLPLAVGDDRTRQLLEEIATLESRLEDMGLDGDCAYERAMSRLYEDMVEELKRRLAAVHSTPLP